MESLFDTIAGLPIHPLVVHFAVVLLPLATLGVMATIYLPRLRKNYLPLSAFGVLVGTLATFVAKQSGEALAERVGLPQRHSDLGTYLLIASVLLTLLTYLLFRQTKKASATGIGALGVLTSAVGALGVLTSAVGALVVVLSILTGHTGAEAVWKSRIADPGITSTGSASGTITMAEVATRNSPEECWSVVDGKVYDLTQWIDKHPGGAVIITSICGKDGTAGFTAEHGGKEKPEMELARYLVGTLKAE